MTKRQKAQMKRNNGLSILCAVLLFGTVLVSPAFAQMSDAELGQTNASVIGALNPEVAPAGGVIDETAQGFSPSASRPSENFSPSASNPGMGFSISLPNSGPETTFYPHPWANNGTNQWYWQGGSTTVWHR
ncbi:MAG: hypothetical protein ACYDGO_03600 [Smithellaceae bacterium]